MAELYIDAFAIAVRSRPRLRPADELPRRSLRRQVAEMIARTRGVPLARVCARHPEPGDPADAADHAATWRALAALGPPDGDETLFLVRSGPVLDPMTAPLAAAVRAAGWTGDDVGISHLAEQGGTRVFRLLGWAVPQDRGATAVIVDDPAYVVVPAEKPAFAAVALRVARTGALRVAGCGETSAAAPAPAWEARNARVFSGPGPCDAWLDLHAALSSGEVAPGERVLLRTTGDDRSGRLLLDVVRPDELKMSSVPVEDPR